MCLILLEIDGPLSLFVQTQKYGINLANFFPAILHQPKWDLDAEVRIRKNQVHSLHLDQSCGIRSHYRQFLAYIPEEIKFFSQQLAKQIPGWELTSSPGFVTLTGESLCFPDYLLTHCSGKKVALELFHTWHAAPLRSRLDQLDVQNEAPRLKAGFYELVYVYVPKRLGIYARQELCRFYHSKIWLFSSSSNSERSQAELRT